MDLNSGIIKQIIGSLPYPLSTRTLIQKARERGASVSVLGMLERLPDKTFNSAEEVQSLINGGLEKFGGLGKFLGL